MGLRRPTFVKDDGQSRVGVGRGRIMRSKATEAPSVRRLLVIMVKLSAKRPGLLIRGVQVQWIPGRGRRPSDMTRANCHRESVTPGPGAAESRARGILPEPEDSGPRLEKETSSSSSRVGIAARPGGQRSSVFKLGASPLPVARFKFRCPSWAGGGERQAAGLMM